MFDNLRQKSAQDAEFLKDEEAPLEAETVVTRRRSLGRMPVRLGLTPMQGFVLALMLFLNVSVLGCFALLVFEKVALPF